MSFFQSPERITEYAGKGALAGGVGCALTSIAFFIAIDRMIAKENRPSTNLARVVSAMCGTMYTYYSFQLGVLCGFLIGGGSATTYETGLLIYKKFFGDPQDTSISLTM